MRIILLFVCFAISGIAVETIGARQKRAGGGTKITIELAPYYVSLRRYFHHVCGGALISERHILTAAHCVLNKSLKRLYHTRVVSGTDVPNERDVGQPIRKIYPHDEFRKGNLWFDIAVATLSENVGWDIKHSRIALPIADPPYREFVKLTTIQLLKTKYSDPGLRELEVRLNPNGPNAVGLDHVIYGLVKHPKALSNIDSGGPLVHKRRIAGIVSWMIPTNHYGCYVVDVFKFKTFIENCIANDTSPTLQHSSDLPWAAKRPRF